MALYERLMGLEEPKLPVHAFLAYLAEVQRGEVTAAQAVAGLGLNVAEQAEATTLFGTFGALLIQGKLNRALEIHDVLILAEELRNPYTTAQAVRTRLGV